VRFHLQQHREHAHEVGRRGAPLAHLQCAAQPIAEVGRHTAERERQLGAQQVADVGEQDVEVDAVVGQPADGGKDVSGLAVEHQVEDAERLVLGHEAQGVAHPLRRDGAVAERQHLVGKRERVPHGTVGRARQHGQRFGIGDDPLFGQHGDQAFAHVRRADALEVEPLQPAEHRRGGLGDLLRLGGGKDEDHARGRLLEHLQQRVPRLAREHVRFVDDVHLVAVVAAGGVHRALAQVAGVLDAAVGRRVDLHHVERGAAAPDAQAARALAARFAVVPLVLAVERHRQHARQRRLAGAAGTAQQVAVGHAPAGDGALQRSRHVRLHGDRGEGLGAVLAGEGERHGLKLQTVDDRR